MESYENIQEDIATKMLHCKIKFKNLPKEKLTLSYIETKIQILNEMWALFSKTHTQIISSFRRPQLIRTNYFKSGMWYKVEEMYVQFKSELKNLFIYQQATLGLKSCSDIENDRRLRLLKIDILTFSGKYTEWSTFKNLFLRLVHENKSLNDSEKLYYLKAHLTGEAKLFIQNVEMNTDDYESVWGDLNKLYNDKISLAKGILKRLLNERELTSESSEGIKGLINTMYECVNSIQNLGANVISWDIMLIDMISDKLDPDTRRAWELTVSRNPTHETQYIDFSEFLIGRVRDLDDKPRFEKALVTKTFYSSRGEYNWCAYCCMNHNIRLCRDFREVSNKIRSNFVQEMKLCYLCLNVDHFVKNCKSTETCQICKCRHHTLLHFCRWYSWPKQIKTNSTLIIPTAILQVKSEDGTYQIVRAILDQCSQGCLVTESTVQSLGLMKIPLDNTISARSGTTKYIVRLTLKSRVDPQQRIKLVAHVIEKVTSLTPSEELPNVGFPFGHLADPEFHIPGEIDILLGAQVYCRVIRNGIHHTPGKYLLAQNTIFGWILSGVNPRSKFNIRRNFVPIPVLRNASDDVDDDDELNQEVKENYVDEIVKELYEMTEGELE